MDTDEELVQLAYYDTFNRPQVIWVSRAQMTERRALIELGGQGLPIRTGNAGIIEDYFDRGIHENGPTLPRVKVAARSGAYRLENGWGWLVGSRWIGPVGTSVEADPRSSETFCKGFLQAGDEIAWVDKMREIASLGPVPRWLLFSTFASPILRFAKHRTFIVHHWGDTGTGKTALAKFAMSAWGDPHLLTANFNRTEKSFVELFSYVDDLPVAFDELQASSLKDHAGIIYAICLERGRARARKAGGLHKEIDNWHSVVRMTGEEPIIGNGRLNLGGQTNRVLQINAHALTIGQARSLHQWMEQRNFGIPGVRFLENLLHIACDPSGPGKIEARYEQIRGEIARQAPEVQDRSGALGVIALSQALASTWFFDTDFETAVQGAISDAVHIAGLIAADEEDLGTVSERALQVFRDHRDANRELWIDLSTDMGREALSNRTYRRLFGIEHGDEVWLLQAEANKLLERVGMPSRRVWVDMKRGMWLKDTNAGRLAPVRRYGSFRNRVYVLDRAQFDGDD
jgi:hypothetical protein